VRWNAFISQASYNSVAAREDNWYDSDEEYVVMMLTKTSVGAPSMDLIVTVKQIKGTCPVYRLGDSIVLRAGYMLDTDRGSPVCMHSLASLMPYYVPLSRGISPQALGLSGARQDRAYLQCLDPCEITGGGTVLFEIQAG
jgi:uncharacterized repeat protein (TIGR04076 family)